MDKQKVKKNRIHESRAFKRLSVFSIILISAIIRAISIHSFIVPNTFAPGGITGIAAIIEIITDGKVNSGYIIFALNVPLLILAFRLIDKKFAIRSLLSILIVSGLTVLLSIINFPVYSPKTEKILPAIAGGVLGGTALAMMLKVGGSTGGTDIIAALIQRKYSAISVSKIIFILDAAVVLASGLIFNSVTPILLAIIEIYMGTKVSESILQGFKTALKFEIVTDRPDELAEIIMRELNRGVTCIPVKGMHTKADRAILVCVVRKRQISAFHKLIKTYAPDSFAYITQASEVIGKGFPSS